MRGCSTKCSRCHPYTMGGLHHNALTQRRCAQWVKMVIKRYERGTPMVRQTVIVMTLIQERKKLLWEGTWIPHRSRETSRQQVLVQYNKTPVQSQGTPISKVCIQHTPYCPCHSTWHPSTLPLPKSYCYSYAVDNKKCAYCSLKIQDTAASRYGRGTNSCTTASLGLFSQQISPTVCPLHH